MKKLLISLLCGSLLLVGCGGDSESDNSDVSDDVSSTEQNGDALGSTVTINETEYPLYEGSRIENLPGMSNAYKVEADTSKVFDFYKSKLTADGWQVKLDMSTGTSGQITYTRGQEVVMVNVFENDGHTTVMIQPVGNRY